MKILARILSMIVLVSAAVFCTNCGGSDGDKKTDEEVQLGKLSTVWVLTSATLDDTDRTADFDDLTLTITGTYTGKGGTYAYSFTGTRPNPSPLPGNGSWKFGTSVTSQILLLPDQMPINYVLSSNDAVLTLTETVDENHGGYSGSGRVEEVTGNWEFVFNKQ